MTPVECVTNFALGAVGGVVGSCLVHASFRLADFARQWRRHPHRPLGWIWRTSR